jgi:hypothetical protein
VCRVIDGRYRVRFRWRYRFEKDCFQGDRCRRHRFFFVAQKPKIASLTAPATLRKAKKCKIALGNKCGPSSVGILKFRPQIEAAFWRISVSKSTPDYFGKGGLFSFKPRFVFIIRRENETKPLIKPELRNVHCGGRCLRTGLNR